MDNLIGKRLDGRYQIESLVGMGGMANVYRGTDTRTGNAIAVKVLKEEFLDNEELVRRFKNESKAISILNHPNIVKVYDVSVTDRLQYIVMEYVDGITLKEYLKQRGGALTWKETVHFATQVLSALQHAHSKGIIHRDVKPQNIMLLADGSIKMMDFGIARFSRAQSQTVSDKAIGSVHYISPEQAKGDKTDARTDIYSVGVMLYEMLSGKLPFDGDGAVSIAIMQISDKAKPLAQVAPNVPEALCQITEKAMEKDPANRYQSAQEMLEAIEAFKRNDVTLISFIGMTEDEFRASEYNSLLKLQKEEEYSDEPAGTIVKQNPKAGRTVKEGQKITLTVSLGTQYITIPETKNMVAEDAEQTLKDMGLRVTKKPMVDATVAPGAVIYTQPAAGETVTGDSMVIVYVSRQDKNKTQPVPSLTGRMLEDARNEIKGKFSVRVVEQASEQPAGTVLSQSPAAGSEARITSAITLVVSTGVPEVVETPTDTGNGDEGDSTIEESWWPSADGSHQIHQLTDGTMWNENGQRCDAQGNPL